ncbi:Asp-tRNA(Asn)/Glu-tRNA(Gln) amidotransferase subunit GatC [Candidatus Spongiihabitans sp.]|uniref:Asp-tRNA(Asn)/Glu-tRNA(Gln) amidotransferase subunit GatC n=1 Tax=Candidatus Spongiihabitans sp. TaxID=3101308 RepID=UPI003C6EA850
MSLTPKEITHIASLARLKTSSEQAEFYATQLSRVLDLVEQMNTIDTSDIEPMSHPHDHLQNAALRLRADEVTATNLRKAYQTVAPATENGLYLVPKVID